MVVLKKYPSSINGGEMEDDEEFDTMVSDSESDLESESDGEEKDDIKLTEPSKTAINNKEGLLEKLSEISWPKDADWIHSLSVVIDQDQEVDVNDDLAREAAFYTQALQGTREAFAKLESKGLPYLRPFDYYAEMVKTDAHMGKVKGKLLLEKKLREEQEERRKAREAKKFSKQVQAEKQKDRAKEKKESIESVKKWRKQRERSGYANDKDEMKLSFEEGGGGAKGKRRGPPGVSPGDRSGGKAGKFGKGQKGMDKKRKSRDFKDSKFGFGGRKGGKKQNTAETTNDFKGFNKESRFGNKKRKQF
ncbi:probable rRNA-processing protein EBP2 homolog [Chenopodium quinoa]|uniref:probable rRNA-processing protein EBP2 homolog n=1 Tax=Chenopodium quinoa TaxID=63459 RepID=UPI000B773474|nr:probable rRNA-processing protein EBP2 homolog [Chenopodium quinoa]